MPRRLATFLLLLAVPLRIYAAAAMIFCGQPFDAIATVQTAAATEQAMHRPAHASSGDLCSMEHHSSDDSGGSSAHGDHLSCAACCCSGMITTARHEWTAPSYATPATTVFIVASVPPPVPHRLERPPRVFVA